MVTFLVLLLNITTKLNTLYGYASVSCYGFKEHSLLPLLEFLFQPPVF